MTDFLISNTDEHLMNFGVLRDTTSMKLLSPAPIFDSGNSMFYTDLGRVKPLSRSELLQQKITAMHDSEEKMLEHVQNKDLVDISRLPSRQEVSRFYSQYGIPAPHSDFIAANFETKKQMLSDFQRGIKISYYLEKQKEKSRGKCL